MYSSVSQSQSAAYALDAADGRIDGQYFGNNIVAGSSYMAAPQAMSRSYVPSASYAQPTSYLPAQSQSAAYALDAADGRIDGQYFGSNIVAGSSYLPTTQVMPTSYVQPGTSYLPTSQSAAYALDAADGRIDGQYFGSNIVTQQPFYTQQYPQTIMFPEPVPVMPAPMVEQRVYVPEPIVEQVVVREPVYVPVPQPIYVQPPPPPPKERKYRIEAVCRDPAKRAAAQALINRNAAYRNNGKVEYGENEIRDRQTMENIRRAVQRDVKKEQALPPTRRRIRNL